MALLTLKNLVYYNLGALNLSIDKKQIFGFTGPSGSGKTLLLRAIADMDPFTGKIFFEEKSICDYKPHLWRRQVSLLPSESQWWFDKVGTHFKTLPDKWLEAVGFKKEVYDWDTNRLSSGEKQRLALLRLLVNQPKVLLLDEPSANLDKKHTSMVEDLLTEYVQNQLSAMLWVSHDLEQLERMCSRIFQIHNGRWEEKK
jgi:ABC-type iron transport system FetAB ATPase subunit